MLLLNSHMSHPAEEVLGDIVVVVDVNFGFTHAAPELGACLLIGFTHLLSLCSLIKQAVAQLCCQR